MAYSNTKIDYEYIINLIQNIVTPMDDDTDISPEERQKKIDEVKQYIEENVSEKEEKNFCGTKVLIRKVYNKGFAFNSMDSEPDKVKKASVITTAVILMLTLAESFREGHKVNKTALTLLSAGAISNTYDRIVRGKVVDYIGIRSDHKILGDVTANLADVYILIGSVLMWMRRIGKR